MKLIQALRKSHPRPVLVEQSACMESNNETNRELTAALYLNLIWKQGESNLYSLTESGQSINLNGVEKLFMEWQRHQELLQKLDECNGALSSENASNDDGINGDQIMKQHIERLHLYNDLKDLSQTLMGKLAELEQLTVKNLYERYEVDPLD